MAKYITKDMHKKFSKLIPELPRKTTLEELWNSIYDKYELEGELTVDSVITHKAVLSFTIKKMPGGLYKIEIPDSEFFEIGTNGDVKEERYDIMIQKALELIYSLKLFKKSSRHKKDKN